MPRALFLHLKRPLGRIYLPCFQSQYPHCSFTQGGVSASREDVSNTAQTESRALNLFECFAEVPPVLFKCKNNSDHLLKNEAS